MRGRNVSVVSANSICVLLVFLLSTALTSIPAHAEIDLTLGIIGEDDRRPVGSADAPWTAIGHLNITGYRKRHLCTGTLIAPRVVLTAADCVIDYHTGQPYTPKNIHFAAGVDRDTVIGRSVGQCTKFPSGFRYVGPERRLPDLPYQIVPLEHFRRNLAVVVLEDDIADAPPAPLMRREVHGAHALIHASYPVDRRFVLQAHAGCRILERRTGLWLTDCDMRGAGGPVLISDVGKLKIAGIMVGAVSKTGTLVVPLTEWPALPMDLECR
jgi:protease YdgD